MSGGHTPGPWRIEAGGEWSIFGPSHEGHPTSFRVLTIRDGVIPTTPDARLIAAAPEMLGLLDEAGCSLVGHDDLRNRIGLLLVRLANAGVSK